MIKLISEYPGVILLTVLLTVGLVIIFKFIWRELINKVNQKVHINKLLIKKPYNEVWKCFSDVNNYPQLYPGWIDEVEEIEEDRYMIFDQYDQEYEAKVKLDKDNGIINLYMDGEVSRTRLFSLSEGETLAVHIGEREDFSLFAWLYLKRTIKSDFKNAKKVIENK